MSGAVLRGAKCDCYPAAEACAGAGGAAGADKGPAGRARPAAAPPPAVAAAALCRAVSPAPALQPRGQQGIPEQPLPPTQPPASCELTRVGPCLLRPSCWGACGGWQWVCQPRRPGQSSAPAGWQGECRGSRQHGIRGEGRLRGRAGQQGAVGPGAVRTAFSAGASARAAVSSCGT